MLTADKFKSLVCVVVEVLNRYNNQSLVGFFKGFVDLNDNAVYLLKCKDTYIILENNDNLFMLRLNDFNIATISLRFLNTHTWTTNTYRQETLSLQREDSLKVLKQIQEYYTNNGKSSNIGLIDTSDFVLDANSYLTTAMKRYNKLTYKFTVDN